MARIVLDQIAHAYGLHPSRPEDYALKRLNHVWDDGGAYALLGPSGCGKTTLLNVISGLIVPSEGRVFFGDRDVTELPTADRNIAQVFQFPVIYDTMTVAQNLGFPLKNRGIGKAEADRRVRDIGKMLELTPILDRKARNLTADLKQKVSLGRGLVRSDVNAILFDEPLTVIDPQLKWQLRAQIKTLHRELGLTMVYVTHDQTEALSFADRVVVMFEGEVVQIGTPEDLFARPAHTFVGYFIGSPGMNVLPGEIAGNRARLSGGHEIVLPDSYPDLPRDRRIEVGIRPEFVRLSRDGKGLPVTVRRVDDIGRIKIARVEFDGRSLNVLAGEDAHLDGDHAGIEFDPQHLHIYADGHLIDRAAVR